MLQLSLFYKHEISYIRRIREMYEHILANDVYLSSKVENKIFSTSPTIKKQTK